MRNLHDVPVIVTLIFSLTFLYAQPDELEMSYFPPSPEASSMVSFVESPINYHTGQVQVSVPIQQMSSIHLEVNLFLNYLGGGIRANQEATQVGVGWSLQGAGVITRTIRGLPDEDGLGYSNITFDPFSQASRDDAAHNRWDLSPDEYHFSFPGHSGKFIVDKNGTIIFHEKNDLLVTETNEGWKIVDPQGNIYLFEEEEEGFAGIDEISQGTVAWYLTSIEHWSGTDELIFNYNSYSDIVVGTSQTQTKFEPTVFAGCSSFTTESSTLLRYSQVLLSSIVGKRYRLDLAHSTRSDILNAQQLDRVELKNLSGALLKYTKLTYDYFGPGNNKLKLEEVKESGSIGGEKGAYTFTYSTADVFNGAGNTQYSVDHWGYPNQSTATSFLPDDPSTFNNPQAFGHSKRAPDIKSLDGILTRIDYPTGWYEELEYENHRYAYIDDLTKPQSDMGILETESVNCSGICTETGSIVVEGSFPEIRIQYNSGTCMIAGDCQNEISITSDASGMAVFQKFDLVSGFEDIICLPPGQYTVGLVQLQNISSTLSVDYYISDTADPLVQIQAGGARIKSITTPDGIRSFNYKNEGKSSGVLLDEPKYSYQFVDYVKLDEFCNQNICSGVMYSSSSIAQPVASAHVVYMEIEEILEDSSKTIYEYEFSADILGANFNLPFTPASDRQAKRGQLKRKTSYAYENGNYRIVDKAETIYETLPLQTFPIYAVYDPTGDDCAPNATMKSYDFSSYWKRPINIVKTRYGSISQPSDSVAVEEVLTYDTQSRFTMAVSFSVTNSDNKEYKTQYSYMPDYNSNETIRDTLVARNRLLPAWQTLKIVDGTVVDGYKSLYTEYNMVTGVRQDTAFYFPGWPIFTGLEFRREVTFDSNNNPIDNGFILQNDIEYYDIVVGKPTQVLNEGWQDPIELQWTPSGQIDLWRFIDFEKDYSYFTTSDLLQSVEEVDGTNTSFTFDDLLRLKTIINCQGVVSTFKYHYSTGGADKNYIQSDISYPKYGEEQTNTTLSSKEIFDGLGRPIQTLLLNQAPGNTSQHLSTWTTYDNVGRPKRAYEPIVVSSSNYSAPSGYYTETEYEPSRLNRITKITPPQSVGGEVLGQRTSDYGANAASDVTGYTAKTLFKITTTDSEGSETTVFTDKRGREVLMRKKKGSSQADTYIYYDDKDRKTTVVPPDAVISNSNLTTQFTYYGDDLLASKKLPDREIENFIYNKRDLLAYRQNANLSEYGTEGTWYAYKQDQYGRNILEGHSLDSALVVPVHNQFDSADIEISLIHRTYGSSGIDIDKLIEERARVLSAEDYIIRLVSYDACGREEMVRGNNIYSISDTLSYQKTIVYDDANNVLNTTELFPLGLSSLSFTTDFIYDHAGRVTGEGININSLGRQSIYNNTFTPTEQIATMTLGNNLQSCDYTYLPNRFLSSINNPSNLGTDLFAMQILYNKTISPGISGLAPLDDGNISGTIWRMAGQNLKRYRYSYDYLKRILNATYYESGRDGRYDAAYQYADDRGNFQNITRQGMMDGSAGQIDDLSITYYAGSNQTKTVTDGAITTLKSGGYKGGTEDYSWDDNGAILHDPSRGADFTQNYLDLPLKIEIPDSNGLVKYLYDANGKYHGQMEYRDEILVSSRYHVGPVEYADQIIDQILTSQGYIELTYSVPELIDRTGIESTGTQSAIIVSSDATVPNNSDVIYEGGQFISLKTGFATNQGGDFEAWIKEFPPIGFRQFFTLKDHLGSTRVIFSDLDNNGAVDASEIINNLEYYPFGALQEGDWDDNAKYNYLYTGQELQRRFNIGYMNYGARFYDPAIGRFMGVDPISDQFPHVSTYNYAENEPIANIDLWGLQKFPATDGGIIQKFQSGLKDIGNSIADFFDFGNFVRLGGSNQFVSNVHSTARTTEQAVVALGDVAQQVIINTAETVGVSGEVVETTGDITTIAGGIITPFQPEIGIPMVETGIAISNAGSAMQVASNVAQGDLSGAAKKVVAETVPGVALKPLRNAVDKMSNTREVSKQILKQQLNTTELIIEKTIDEKVKGSNK